MKNKKLFVCSHKWTQILWSVMESLKKIETGVLYEHYPLIILSNSCKSEVEDIKNKNKKTFRVI